MTALPVTGRREARALAANAVLLSYFERFGKFPSDQDRLWQLDPFERLDLVRARLGTDAVALGAATLPVAEFLHSGGARVRPAPVGPLGAAAPSA